ncbi:MAG: hypothetical protein JWM74_6177, partial [Myxococcaceae bacterium]|nr:hypothetical protein [Myxococcaceae bacterium]
SDDGLGTGQLKVSMPGTWVSNGRRSDGAFEGIVTLAQTFALPDGYPIPGQQSVEPGQTHIQGGESGGCPVKKFAPPVKPPVVTSPFSSTRSVVVSGKTYVGHWGVDLRASSGTTLYSVGKGKVLVSYTSTSFGESVVLDIEGVGAVRYAHMKSRSVQKGATVTCGQVIGEADNTGLTQAPHLHFELTPNGNYNTNSAKIDPFPCIDVNACVGCPLDVEYSGATKYTLHQVYDSTKNTGDEDILVTASSVTLSPDPQAEGYLRPTAGAISYTRTMKQYVSPTLTCAISTTGSGQVVAGDPMAGALTCLPPPQPDGSDFFYTTTLPMATKFTLTTTNSCGQGSTEEGGAGWLLIPSMYSGKGYTATRDAKVLSGTYSQPTGPGGGATETWEWNFTRVEK